MKRKKLILPAKPKIGPPPCTDVDGVKKNHDAHGRVVAGNKAARGNALNIRMTEWRMALAEGVRAKDIRRIIRAMVKAAIRGDVVAARSVFERTLGLVPIDEQLVDDLYFPDDQFL